jgi:hypothetical protein
MDSTTTMWWYFWIVAFVVAGGSFAAIAAVVAWKGVADLRWLVRFLVSAKERAGRDGKQ